MNRNIHLSILGDQSTGRATKRTQEDEHETCKRSQCGESFLRTSRECVYHTWFSYLHSSGKARNQWIRTCHDTQSLTVAAHNRVPIWIIHNCGCGRDGDLGSRGESPYFATEAALRAYHPAESHRAPSQVDKWWLVYRFQSTQGSRCGDNTVQWG